MTWQSGASLTPYLTAHIGTTRLSSFWKTTLRTARSRRLTPQQRSCYQQYSPLPATRGDATIAAFIDHSFYTTINVVRTIESLLGVPPMNANDSRAAVMAPLFSGSGQQPAFSADYRNRDNGLIYQMNTEEWKEGANLDFSHADAADIVC